MARSEPQPRKRLTAAEQAARNTQIAYERIVQGWTWPQIAKAHHMTETGARKAFVAWQEAEKEELATLDPLAEVATMLAYYDGLIATSFQIRNRAEGVKNLNSMLGANNSIAQLVERRAALLQAAGLIPKNLGKLKVEFDLRFLVSVILTTLRENDIPIDVQDKIADVVRRRMMPTGAAATLN